MYRVPQISTVLTGSTVLFTATIFILCSFIYKLLFDPLKHIPGPFAARLSRLWELKVTRQGDFQKQHLELHHKYGKIVRLAPNKYSFSDPEIVKQIYGHGSKFVKAPFYGPFGNPDYVHADLFSEQDPNRHAAKRRKVASLYSMTTLLSYEPFVDKCNATFCQKLSNFAADEVSFDVPQWMQFYAFDVIGEISVGQSFGFLDGKREHDNILEAIHQSMVYGSRVGLFPGLHPVICKIAAIAGFPTPVQAVIAYINAQREARETGLAHSDRDDFLTKLRDLREKGKLGDPDIFNSLGANIAAGSDTTGVTMSTVVYYLARSKDKAETLQREIDMLEAGRTLSSPVTFQECQKLPYLQAVLKETLRIHPATGQLLSRLVPPGGAILSGQHFPEGVEVGTSPWLIHFDPNIFGSNVHEFRPERWLEDAERARTMESSLLTFGAGARTCLGKNISLLEISKLTFQLFSKFNFDLSEPEREWDLDMVWFVKQKFNARVKVRQQKYTAE
ncbi:hypothetical protein ONS95_002639 [Cadophora gregata]|uniref:uncharacterized protein n=1 Tax=Cadophora gregata TaxID=51156 RepID=UPI0026DD392E|nr:uncharacterized protein ONS95_002639 [Cadophora gregata]KAK0109972.1 hypothetical protein ONS95_002639 [Cadophora gregata]KAK0110402.1 hypothetical protein ONS96_002015 [Cadophora gregata f. sp. sojae]